MDFLHPLLLGGAAAALVPIILHMVMRPKPKVVEFPALRFLKARRQSNRRHMRMRHWLLLLFRMLVLVLLALALARPSLNISGIGADQEAPVAAALVFDTSPRMQYRHENHTRLEQAQELSDWLLTQLPAESQVAVIEPGIDSAVFQIDMASARRRIERLKTVGTSSPLATVIESAMKLLADSPLKRREIYVFTDLAQGAWQVESSSALTAKIAAQTDLSLYIIDVGVEHPRDVSLGRLQLSSQMLAQTAPLTIETDIGQLGGGGTHTVQLWLNDVKGNPQKRSEETIELTEGQSQSVVFNGIRPDRGIGQGYVRVASDDGLPEDNTRFFTVEVSPAWRILIAAPKPTGEQAFFLAEALAPTEFRKTGQARFQYDLISLDELATQKLSDYAAVFVLDPTPLPPETWRRLTDYATEGGGVALCLGPNAQPADQFNSATALDLLPGRVTAQIRKPEGDVSVNPSRYEHPLMSKFRSLQGSIAWDTFPVYRYWQLENLTEDALSLLSYNDAKPMIIERPIGRGRVLCVTTPFSQLGRERPWNLLPTGIDAWPFVMLVNEMALYLAGASDNSLNYAIGQPVQIRTHSDEPISAFVLTNPHGEAIKQSTDPRQATITIPPQSAPGNYRLKAGGGKATLDTGFSVNLAPEATDLTRITSEQLTQLLGEGKFQIARNKEEISRDVGLSRVGRELYPWILGLVVLFLAGEYVLANHFYREPSGDAPEMQAAPAA